MSTSVTPAPSSTAAKAAGALGALLAVILLCAVAGAVLAGRLLAAEAPAHAPAAGTGPFGVAEDAPTSFGFVAVEHAETLKGLTPRELGGATHGIGGFVGRDKALVQAAVTITNTGDEPLAYSPGQFRVATRSRRGAVKRIPLAHASVRDGELQPDAALDARLSFVVPRDGSRLEIEFLDPGRAAPIRILLDARAGRLTAEDRRALEEGHGAGGAHDGHDHRHEG